MNARPLRACPRCLKPLTEDERAAMGLRNNDLLSALCPGRIGPSDIDAVVHNGASNPHRLAVVEYKGGAPVGIGQRILFGAIQGDWIEPGTGRALTIKVFVIADDREPSTQLLAVTNWTFEGRGQRAPSPPYLPPYDPERDEPW